MAIDSDALDRHITGNYGEDQHQGTCYNSDCESWSNCPHGYEERACEEEREVSAAEARWEMSTER